MGNNEDTIAIKQLKLIDLSKRRLNVYGNSKVRVFNNISKILYMRITKKLFFKMTLDKRCTGKIFYDISSAKQLEFSWQGQSSLIF